MIFCVGLVFGVVVGFLFGILLGSSIGGGTCRVPPLLRRHIPKNYGIR